MKKGDFGVDISFWQGAIDFAKLATKAKFIIPRQGYSSSTDTRFFEYVEGAKKNNIAIPGVYHFIYATNCGEAMANADKVIADVERADLPKSTIIFADLEYDTITNAAKKGITLDDKKCREIVIAFCEQIKRYGYATAIYLNIDFLHRYGVDIAEKYDIWLAEWGTSIPSIPCLCWQARVSTAGEIPGISGKVDVTIWQGKHSAKEQKQDHSDPSIRRVALEVIDGKYGVYPERKTRLIEAGYNYDTIQAVVNEMLKHKYLDGKTGLFYDTLDEVQEAGLLKQIGKTLIIL